MIKRAQESLTVLGNFPLLIILHIQNLFRFCQKVFSIINIHVNRLVTTILKSMFISLTGAAGSLGDDWKF